MKSTAKLFNYISLGLNLAGFLLHFIIGIIIVASGGEALKRLGIKSGWVLIVISLLLLTGAIWNVFSNKVIDYTKQKNKISIINGIMSIIFGFIVTGIIILNLKDEDYGFYKIDAKAPKFNNNDELNKEKK